MLEFTFRLSAKNDEGTVSEKELCRMNTHADSSVRRIARPLAASPSESVRAVRAVVPLARVE